MRWSLLLPLLPVLLSSPSARGQVAVPTTQVVAADTLQVQVTWQRDRLEVRVLDLAGGPVALDEVSGRAAIRAERTASAPGAQERAGALRPVRGDAERLELSHDLGDLSAQGLVRVRVQLTRGGRTERFAALWRDGRPLRGAWHADDEVDCRGPHGGVLVASGGLVYEVVYTIDQVRVWTYDALGAPLPPGPRGTANMRVERLGGTFQERMARLRPADRDAEAHGYLQAAHALGSGERVVIRLNVTRASRTHELEVVLRGCTPSWSWSCARRCGGARLEPGTCGSCGGVLRRQRG